MKVSFVSIHNTLMPFISIVVLDIFSLVSSDFGFLAASLNFSTFSFDNFLPNFFNEAEILSLVYSFTLCPLV